MSVLPLHVIIWLFVVWPLVAVGGVVAYLVFFNKLKFLDLPEDRVIKGYGYEDLTE